MPLIDQIYDALPSLLLVYWVLATGAALFALLTKDVAPTFR
jgi:hypothetical protein